MKSNKDYRKRQYEPDITPEKPEYDTKWSPTNRVSKVMYEDIYDFTKPFLKERWEKLIQNLQQIPVMQSQSNVNEYRFDKKADARKAEMKGHVLGQQAHNRNGNIQKSVGDFLKDQGR